MTLKEVRTEISRLQNIERQLERENREKHQVAAQQFVGRCYRYKKDTFLKIIDVPRVHSTMTGERYNEYQFPAVFLKYPKKPNNRYIRDDLDEFYPCYCDTVYLNIDIGKPGCPTYGEHEHYQEISQEEFAAEFDKCMESFKEQIGISKPKPMTTAEFTDIYCGPCGTQRCKHVNRTFDDRDGPVYWCMLYNKECDNCRREE